MKKKLYRRCIELGFSVISPEAPTPAVSVWPLPSDHQMGAIWASGQVMCWEIERRVVIFIQASSTLVCPSFCLTIPLSELAATVPLSRPERFLLRAPQQLANDPVLRNAAFTISRKSKVRFFLLRFNISVCQSTEM